MAETGAVKGLNVTEDIGDLVGGSNFAGALGSRPGPFLKWDPAESAAPPASVESAAPEAAPDLPAKAAAPRRPSRR